MVSDSCQRLVNKNPLAGFDLFIDKNLNFFRKLSLFITRRDFRDQKQRPKNVFYHPKNLRSGPLCNLASQLIAPSLVVMIIGCKLLTNETAARKSFADIWRARSKVKTFCSHNKNVFCMTRGIPFMLVIGSIEKLLTGSAPNIDFDEKF
jgi:hypothetical protein